MGRGRPRKPVTNPLTPAGDAVADPPDYLDEVGRTTWLDLAPELTADGRLTKESLPAFAAYCQAVAEHRIATLEMQKPGGRVVACGTGTKQSPWVGLQREAARIIKDVGSLFLLNPASKARGPALMTPAAKKEADQLEAEFLTPPQEDRE